MDDYYSDNQPELIHCPNCGEDYAATYRSCPFCNAANTRRSGSSRSSRSSSSSGRSNSRPKGKVRTNTRGGGYGGQRTPLSIIGIVIAVVLVVATVIVVFSLIRSALTGGKNKNTDAEDSGSAVTTPVEEDESEEEKSEMVIVPDGLSLSQTTLTLTEEEGSYTLTATPDPEGWVGQIIWSSNNGSVATVNQAGVVSYVGDGTCSITASAAGVVATCDVTCTSGGSGTEDADTGSTGSTESTGTATTLVIKAYGSTMGTDVTIRIGESVPFVAEGGDGSNYTWSIDDSSIASVDSSTGTCVGLSSGVTYLNVTSGGETLSLKVIVR